MTFAGKLFVYLAVLFITVGVTTTIGSKLNTSVTRFEGQQAAAFNSALSDTPAAPDFHFEIADTPATQTQGLSGRTDVPHNYGMLFIFPKDAAYGFWMKDMLVPIDMIWLSDKGEVIGIEDSVLPSTYPHVFYPSEPVRYVLETRAGEAGAQGWSVGSTIKIPLQD